MRSATYNYECAAFNHATCLHVYDVVFEDDSNVVSICQKCNLRKYLVKKEDLKGTNVYVLDIVKDCTSTYSLICYHEFVIDLENSEVLISSCTKCGDRIYAKKKSYFDLAQESDT